MSSSIDLQSRCELLRGLHRPGAPLLLPNAWDVASARAGVAGGLRDPEQQAAWLRAVREAATSADYRLVINARLDVFFEPWLAGGAAGSQEALVPEAVRRARAYLDAGVDCVYPIVLWETGALE